MPTEFASLERRVRRLDRLFRWGLGLLPGTVMGRPLLRELIVAYENADESGRGTLRTLLQHCDDFVGNVALPRPADSPERFRQHLLHFSLVYASGDPRDSNLWLQDLCQEALAAGVTIEPILRQAAAISSAEGGPAWSAKGELLAAAKHVDVFKSRAKPRKTRTDARTNRG